MKTKQFILLICLFTVLTTKSFAAYTAFFSKEDYEQLHEYDEEDNSDEEDSEEEKDSEEEEKSSEKEMFCNDIHADYFAIKKHSFLGLSRYFFDIDRYISPIPDCVFSPPEEY